MNTIQYFRSIAIKYLEKEQEDSPKLLDFPQGVSKSEILLIEKEWRGHLLHGYNTTYYTASHITVSGPHFQLCFSF